VREFASPPDRRGRHGPADARDQGREVVGDHRRQRHAARRPGPDGERGPLSTASATGPYGTNVVAASTPGKGGQDVEGNPGVRQGRRRRRQGRRECNAHLRTGRFAATRSTRRFERGHRHGHLGITEHVPSTRCSARTPLPAAGHTMMAPTARACSRRGRRTSGSSREIFSEGASARLALRHAHVPDSATSLTQLGSANSTIVGIGGDPVVGSSFIDVLAKFETDPRPS